jgi:hypothetical protein
MRGATIHYNTIFALTIVVILIVLISDIVVNVAAEEGVYSRFAQPITWGAKMFVVEGGKSLLNKCDDLMSRLSKVFVNELEVECSNWYRECTRGVEDAPPSPWINMENSAEDLYAVNYMKFDCRPSGIDDLREEWAKSNSFFGAKSEYEQYNIIKNACGAIIAKRIY